jgi:hypothetical protein
MLKKMYSVKMKLPILLASFVALACAGGCFEARGQMHSMESSTSAAKESAETKIARALSAGPAEIAKAATVAEMDGQGKLKILRQGTNGFTCMPGDPTGIGLPPMCADAVAMQWNDDFMHHKPKPTTTTPGIEYMLAGATQRSDSDPYDTTSPPIKIGPHWMILWAFDPKTTALPTTHKPTGAYINVGRHALRPRACDGASVNIFTRNSCPEPFTILLASPIREGGAIPRPDIAPR